jgi:hypothetical protein
LIIAAVVFFFLRKGRMVMRGVKGGNGDNGGGYGGEFKAELDVLWRRGPGHVAEMEAGRGANGRERESARGKAREGCMNLGELWGSCGGLREGVLCLGFGVWVLSRLGVE